MMKKLASFNFARIIAALVGVFCVAYYFLLQDSILHISIASIIERSARLDIEEHIIVLGLLPIYIATMIFGAAFIGSYLGHFLQQILKYFSKKTSNCN
jgi:hypothetical protein